jgi:predicted TIM-barrel fold metal-dependent hydrolase
MQVLSYTNTVPKDLPASKAVYFNAMANDELAAYVEAGPSRFAAFATLPMQDPHAAAAELERCVTQLGFKGALLDAWFNGHGYEEERFLPVFEKAAELDVPISLHPSFVDCAEPWRGRHGAQLPIWGHERALCMRFGNPVRHSVTKAPREPTCLDAWASVPWRAFPSGKMQRRKQRVDA